MLTTIVASIADPNGALINLLRSIDFPVNRILVQASAPYRSSSTLLETQLLSRIQHNIIYGNALTEHLAAVTTQVGNVNTTTINRIMHSIHATVEEAPKYLKSKIELKRLHVYPGVAHGIQRCPASR